MTINNSKNIIELIISTNGMWREVSLERNYWFVCCATFNIITTNKNKTATAPTYTISIIIPKNSEPIIIKRHEIIIKSKNKKKTECTVFFETVTIIADIIEIIEKK